MLVIEFVVIFQYLARQLKGDQFAYQWAHAWLLEPTIIPGPEVAAEWANLGYMPREATWDMMDGLTLEQARRIR